MVYPPEGKRPPTQEELEKILEKRKQKKEVER